MKKLIPITSIEQLKQGGVIWYEGTLRRVGGICGDMVFILRDNSHYYETYSIADIIEIGYELEVEEEKWMPEVGGNYYIPDIYHPGMFTTSTWNNDPTDKRRYEDGLVFKTVYEATEACKKMLNALKDNQ